MGNETRVCTGTEGSAPSPQVPRVQVLLEHIGYPEELGVRGAQIQLQGGATELCCKVQPSQEYEGQPIEEMHALVGTG